MKAKEKSDKKVYEKPAVIHRQTIEGVASACDTSANGKGGGSCTVLNS